MSSSSESRSEGSERKLLLIIIIALLGVLQGWSMYDKARMFTYMENMEARLDTNDKQLAAIEADRFRAGDGRDLEREVASLRLKVFTLPPVEWQNRIRHLELWRAKTDPRYKPPVGDGGFLPIPSGSDIIGMRWPQYEEVPIP